MTSPQRGRVGGPQKGDKGRDSIFSRGDAQCSKMDLLKNDRACVSGCDFHKVHTLGVSKMFLSNS